MDRTPRTGDRIVLYSEPMRIYRITDRGSGAVVVTEDSVGWRIERRADALYFDDEAQAWREIASRPVAS